MKRFRSRPDRTQPVRRAAQRGLTLVEMMVAMVIGLVLVVAMSALFVNSSTSRREVELSSDVIESGRYGIDVLARELTQTGFYGLLGAPTGATSNVGNLCDNTVALWRDSLPSYVVGIQGADVSPACLARKAGTDAIFIQRASTCVAGSAGCGAEDPALAYLQVSECGEEYNTPGKQFVVEKGNNAAFVLKTKTCAAATAERRQLVRRIYYVSAADVLEYIEFRPDAAPITVPIVENIEQMQISYGFDTKPGDGSGTADCYAPGPDTCGLPANAWSEAVGVRIWLLARSSSASSNTGNAATFTLDDTTINITAANRNLKRRVYSVFIPFITPKARREF